jgi:peptidoglycan/LPS O-acetylase OafA/YrhL
LWTLRYEVLAYMGTALAFYLGLMKKNWMIFAQFALCALAWPIAHMTGLYDKVPATLQAILRFGICYGLGAAVYAYRDRLTFNILGIPLLGLITALAHDTVIFEVIFNIWLGYIVFWIAYVKIPKLNWMQDLHDASYGIYIYHWCILQWVFYKMPTLGVIDLLAIVVPITLALSYASWHFVEKPMLSRKKWFAEKLRGKKQKNVGYAAEAAE